jgi:hypothetical protein
MGVLDNARGFSQQVTREYEDDGTDNTEHTDLGPFGLTLSRFVEFCEGEISNPQKTEYCDGEAEYQAAILDVALVAPLASEVLPTLTDWRISPTDQAKLHRFSLV